MMECFRSSGKVQDSGRSGTQDGKAQFTGHFGRQKVRRERRAESETRCGGSIGAGAGEGVGLTPRGCEPPSPVMALQDSGVRGSYAGRSKSARERVREGCSDV